MIKMDKIPTASEFLKLGDGKTESYFSFCMIEFAKLHVRAALKEAMTIGSRVDDSDIFRVALCNAYSLENIK